MIRGNAWVYVFVLIALTPVSGPELRLAASAADIKALRTARDSTEVEFVLTMSALFSIIDLKYSEKALQRAPDFHHFRDRVDNWKVANSDEWGVIQERLNYCRQLRQTGGLKTELFAADRDVRWELYIRYGPPTYEVVTPRHSGGHSEICTVWTYTWTAPDPGQSGWEFSCQSRPGMDHPVEILFGDKDRFPAAAAIWPEADCSIFPAANDSADLWFSIWVKGSQFSLPTLDSGLLAMSVELFDSSRTVALARKQVQCDLQIMRGVLEATHPEERRLLRAMGYVGFADIAPGRYAAHVEVIGAAANDGDCWVELEVSAHDRISDLLLLHRSLTSIEAALPGIIRGADVGLFHNPEARYAPGTKLQLHCEALLPTSDEVVYQVEITLLPLPAVAPRTRSVVEVGSAVVIADSLNQPVPEGYWGSSARKEFLDSLERSHSSIMPMKLYRRSFRNRGGLVTVKAEPVLKAGLKNGRYLLTLTITDPTQGQFYLTTRRIIRLATPGSFFSGY